MKNKTLLLLTAALALAACNQNKSQELNLLLEDRINDEMTKNETGLTVRDVRTVLRHDNEYRGEVELKDAQGNLQTCELDATYDGQEVVYEIFGLKTPEPEAEPAETEEAEEAVSAAPEVAPAKPAPEVAPVAPAPEKPKPAPVANAWQGTYTITTDIFQSVAYMTLEIVGDRVTGTYTASNYAPDYAARVTGTIHGNKMSLQTHEPGSGKVTRWMDGTINGVDYVCKYRTKNGGNIGTFTWR